jgi:hypothetical protein
VNSVEKVLDRLEGVVPSNGSWKALCPAHDDTEPSLSVSPRATTGERFSSVSPAALPPRSSHGSAWT